MSDHSMNLKGVQGQGNFGADNSGKRYLPPELSLSGCLNVGGGLAGVFSRMSRPASSARLAKTLVILVFLMFFSAWRYLMTAVNRMFSNSPSIEVFLSNAMTSSYAAASLWW